MYAFISKLIRETKTRIALIDNYIDDSVLVQLSKRKPGVTVDFYDGKISSKLRQDVERHYDQYLGVTLHSYYKAHDRFLIIDEEGYYIGNAIKIFVKNYSVFQRRKS